MQLTEFLACKHVFDLQKTQTCHSLGFVEENTWGNLLSFP